MECCDMKAYIISILGITLCGVLIDIILPSGSTSKYIKSIYSIFVVAVILNPLITFFAKSKDVDINYNNFETSQTLIDYINTQKIKSIESTIIEDLKQKGLTNIEIKINYAWQDNQLVYKSCLIDLKNMVYQPQDKHTNKYELITEVVQQHTNLSNEVIIFDE